MDDDGGFKIAKNGTNYDAENLDPREKVSRYLNGLDKNQTPSPPMPQSSRTSLSNDSTNKELIVSGDFQTGVTQIKTLSTTSSSCISDEGCYGSSDFSSERESSKLKQRENGTQYETKQDHLNVLNENLNSLIRHSQFSNNNQIILSNPSSLKNYNLTRFEKIYNSNDFNNSPLSVLTTGSANIDQTFSPYVASLSNNRQQQIVNSISGSYV